MRSIQAREIAAIAAERGFDMAKTAFDVELYLPPGGNVSMAGATAAPFAPKDSSDGERSLPPSAKAPSAAPVRPGAIASGDARLGALTLHLAGGRLLFAANSARLLPGQEGRIRDIGETAIAIVERSRELALAPRIEAVGHAAGKTSDASGDGISVARARAAAGLVSRSNALLGPYIVARGAGNAEPIVDESSSEDAAQNRSASFTATFR
jgi:outer membrane protein OmpA-like peptidoglycan-associated protein